MLVIFVVLIVTLGADAVWASKHSPRKFRGKHVRPEIKTFTSDGRYETLTIKNEVRLTGSKRCRDEEELGSTTAGILRVTDIPSSSLVSEVYLAPDLPKLAKLKLLRGNTVLNLWKMAPPEEKRRLVDATPQTQHAYSGSRQESPAAAMKRFIFKSPYLKPYLLNVGMLDVIADVLYPLMGLMPAESLPNQQDDIEIFNAQVQSRRTALSALPDEIRNLVERKWLKKPTHGPASIYPQALTAIVSSTDFAANIIPLLKELFDCEDALVVFAMGHGGFHASIVQPVVPMIGQRQLALHLLGTALPYTPLTVCEAIFRQQPVDMAELIRSIKRIRPQYSRQVINAVSTYSRSAIFSVTVQQHKSLVTALASTTQDPTSLTVNQAIDLLEDRNGIYTFSLDKAYSFLLTGGDAAALTATVSRIFDSPKAKDVAESIKLFMAIPEQMRAMALYVTLPRARKLGANMPHINGSSLLSRTTPIPVVAFTRMAICAEKH